MRRGRFFAVGFTLAAFLTIGGTAAADPVVITSGQIAVGGVQDLFSRGFLRAIHFDFATDDFSISGGTSDGIVQRPLAPGMPSPVSLVWEGGAPQMAGLISNPIVNTTPSTTPGPFELSGTLSLFELGIGTPIFSGTVFGRGTATFRFVTTPTGGSILSGATYDFNGDAPVPEPATLVLVGAGLAGVVARRRAARR